MFILGFSIVFNATFFFLGALAGRWVGEEGGLVRAWVDGLVRVGVCVFNLLRRSQWLSVRASRNMGPWVPLGRWVSVVPIKPWVQVRASHGLQLGGGKTGGATGRTTCDGPYDWPCDGP